MSTVLASQHEPQLCQGLVVGAYGRHFDVALEHNFSSVLKCQPRGRKNRFACGDVVELVCLEGGQGIINRHLPRRNLLWRSDAFREKILAANLSQIVIVVATDPRFSDLLISRCLVVASHHEIKPLIALNKIDLTEQLVSARKTLAPFAQLGYPCIELSALSDISILAKHLVNEQSIFIGQSGMGKSTLTNALIPEALAVTREISSVLDSGKHTTTHTRLYPFGKGWFIDSPGLQEFGLAQFDEDDLQQGFIEFHDFLGQCRFHNCRHESEPGCALLKAAADGSIHPRRFEHFKTIRSETRLAHKQNRGW